MRLFKFSFLLMSFCHIPIAMAQEDKPYLVTEGKQWAVYYEQSWNQEEPIVTITFRLQGDTIINGCCYKKKWFSVEKDLSDMYPLPNSYMREESGKVYILDKDGEELWFDYTAQVGDTLCFVQNQAYGLVVSIDDAILEHSDGKQRKHYKVMLGQKTSSDDIVFIDRYIDVYEDIGVLNSPTYGYGLGEHQLFTYGNSFALLCVHENGTVLYQSPDGCYKEKDTDIKLVVIDDSYESYYDLMGRKVTHPTRGIYIKDGRKVVIK